MTVKQTDRDSQTDRRTDRRTDEHSVRWTDREEWGGEGEKMSVEGEERR